MNLPLKPPPLAKTDEQVHILDLASKTDANLCLQAFAGCGKTSTLEMLERVVPSKPILYLVFNKRNAEEAEERMLSTTTVRTVNSMGHRVWAQSIGKKMVLSMKKSGDLLKDIISESPKGTHNEIWSVFWEVTQGVALAKALGYIPDDKYPHAKRLISKEAFHARLEEVPDDLTSDLIDAVLTRSIRTAYNGFIDFNDQIYMPALFGGTFPRFPLVLVDEAQDLSPVNHALLHKLCKVRTVIVGDPAQSIYAFRGAEQEGMAKLKERYEMTVADLSVSFRCPRAIVENARWRVPQFKWIKEGGHVESLKSLRIADIPDAGVIICRNNAPLFRLALLLLSNKRSVSVSGSDVGPKIVSLMKKLGPEDMPKASVLSAANDWLQEKLAKGSKTAQDMYECMRVFATFGDTLQQAINYAEHLFAQQGTIRLMTGHKAKGLEFDHVIHIDPWLINLEEEQERNLKYVIGTRSANKYFEVDSNRIVA